MPIDVTIRDLKRLIMLLTDLGETGKYVYRGYSKEEQLYPLLFRGQNDFRNKESEFIEDFDKYGSAYGKILNHIDLLSNAQHFGLPTRLLDFTHNPLTALFFATFTAKELEKPDDDKFYYIRYLDIAKNDKNDEKENCWLIDDLPIDYIVKDRFDKFETNLASLALKGIKCAERHYFQQMKKKLLLLNPKATNNRIMMQQGLFMLPYNLREINGSLRELEIVKEEHIRLIEEKTTLIRISAHLRDDICNFMDGFGINTYRLMPDLSNVCDALRKKHGS